MSATSSEKLSMEPASDYLANTSASMWEESMGCLKHVKGIELDDLSDPIGTDSSSSLFSWETDWVEESDYPLHTSETVKALD